jgi:nucleotide-binding universal stress UspA family protein
MKTLLVPTDFSPSSENAARYAAELARLIKAKIRLVHVYQVPVTVSDVPVLMVSSDELEKNAKRGLQRVRDLLANQFPGLEIETETRLGDVADELEEVTNDTNAYAMVVGKHGASGVERFFFGSTTLSLARRSSIPVLSVPTGYNNFALRNIALATDHSGIAVKENDIKAFVFATGAQLHLIHVQESGKDSFDLKPLLPDLHPIRKTLQHEEFGHAVDNYIRDNKVDLMIILPHHHSFMERLLYKTHTAELIQKLPIPVLTMPQK